MGKEREWGVDDDPCNVAVPVTSSGWQPCLAALSLRSVCHSAGLHCGMQPCCHVVMNVHFLSHAHTATPNSLTNPLVVPCFSLPYYGVYSLRENKVGAEGAAAIAEALKINNTLHTLV